MSQPAHADSRLQTVFVSVRRELEHFLARRVRCPQLAEDLASEIYLRLERAEAFVGSESEARRYLFRMAANIAIDHVKISKRRAEILHEGRDLFESTVASPEGASLARSELGIIDAALAELPPKARDILFQSRVNGLTHEEIARNFDISKSSIEKYIIRSLRHCRQRLREVEAAGDPDRVLPPSPEG